MSEVYIGIGSNLEDRREHIERSILEIKDLPFVTIEKVSSIIETEPLGDSAQPKYLNCVIKLTTTLAPRQLLRKLQAIESEHKRLRTHKNAARTLDLDILLYDKIRIDEPALTIPHPRMWERDFVLTPLREIEPGIDKKNYE